LVSVYFDTDTLRLRNKGLSLRVRRIGRRYVQTIKQESGKSAGLFARNEWERDIGGKRPDLDAAHDTGFEPLLSKKLHRDLKPLFETRVRRTVCPIHSGDSGIELTIDRGKVVAGRQSSPLCEVELELKRGENPVSFSSSRARLLSKSQSSSRSRARLSAATRSWPEAVKASAVALTPDSSRQAAFQTIARACLHQLVAHEPAMQSGDSEALHQMRVALRRMRAAISLFSDMLVGPQTEALKAGFKWISGELAPARELDVFIKRGETGG
jgi:triphosphatase